MRVGSIGYCTEQGLGHLLKWFFDMGVVTDPMIHVHRRLNRWEWYPEGTPRLANRPFDGPEVDKWLESIDVFLAFETPFDWTLLPRMKARGIRTCLIPMYEWYPENPPAEFDRFICPSLLDLDIFAEKYGADRCCFVPIPVPQGTWQLRTRAERYLHNAGNIGYRGHKGTLEVLLAMQHVKNPLQLTVRYQDENAMREVLRRVPTSVLADKRISFKHGSIPYGQMFADHDVYVAPEKFNGLSLPLQEARAAGLAVMASDRYPANTWLPEGPLIPVKEYQKAKVAGPYLTFDEAVVDPKEVAAVMDQWYGEDISAFSYSGKAWAEQNSWENLRPKFIGALS